MCRAYRSLRTRPTVEEVEFQERLLAAVELSQSRRRPASLLRTEPCSIATTEETRALPVGSFEEAIKCVVSPEPSRRTRP